MLLEVKNLRREFGGVVAVDDVSLNLAEGEILGMVGANGSGKTTCFNMITRLLEPTRGSLTMDGTDYTRISPSKLAGKGISRTFQHLRLFEDLTVGENVALGMYCRSGIPSRIRRGEKFVRKQVAEMLEFAGIGDFGHQLPRELPYGTQRVVEISRALASQPRLMLLDEPFAGMSNGEAEVICGLLLQVQERRGTALVIVDHNVEVLMGITKRMVALAEGRVIAQGSSSEVMKDPLVLRSYFGSDA